MSVQLTEQEKLNKLAKKEQQDKKRKDRQTYRNKHSRLLCPLLVDMFMDLQDGGLTPQGQVRVDNFFTMLGYQYPETRKYLDELQDMIINEQQ